MLKKCEKLTTHLLNECEGITNLVQLIVGALFGVDIHVHHLQVDPQSFGGEQNRPDTVVHVAAE